jgi:large subunit ribosomal protein LX
MSRKVWRATGEYMKRKRRKVFSKEILATSEAHVREKILSELGSRHRVKRRDIKIADIVEIKPEEARDLDIRRVLGVESEV